MSRNPHTPWNPVEAARDILGDPRARPEERIQAERKKARDLALIRAVKVAEHWEAKCHKAWDDLDEQSRQRRQADKALQAAEQRAASGVAWDGKDRRKYRAHDVAEFYKDEPAAPTPQREWQDCKHDPHDGECLNCGAKMAFGWYAYAAPETNAELHDQTKRSA